MDRETRGILNKRAYKYFVILAADAGQLAGTMLERLPTRLESGWEYKSDANDRMKELAEFGVKSRVLMRAKARAVLEGRANPRRRNPKQRVTVSTDDAEGLRLSINEAIMKDYPQLSVAARRALEMKVFRKLFAGHKVPGARRVKLKRVKGKKGRGLGGFVDLINYTASMTAAERKAYFDELEAKGYFGGTNPRRRNPKGGTVLKTGVRAYFDTFQGLLPVKVLAVKAPKDKPIFDLGHGKARVSVKVLVKVIGTHGAYKNGEKIWTNSVHVVPKRAIHKRGYSKTIGGYDVQPDKTNPRRKSRKNPPDALDVCREVNRRGDLTEALVRKIFLKADESHLWPIRGRFNVTKRAIGRLSKLMREGLVIDTPYEYAAALDAEISNIVNDPRSM